MLLQDFLNYTEVDPNSRYTVTSTKIDVVGLDRSEDAHVYRDFGTNYFSDDFTHKLTVYVNSASTANGFLRMSWGLANALNDVNGLRGAAENYLEVYISAWSGTNTLISLAEYYGTNATDNSIALSLDTPYYLTIKRDEAVGTYGTLYCYIYSDSARTTLVDTLSLTLRAKLDFRYLYAANSFNNSTTGLPFTGYAENFYIEGAAVTDTGSGADSVLLSLKSFTVADTGSGLDSIVLDKGYIYVTVNDTGTGADEITKTLLRFELTDSGTGVDSVSLVKRLTITDSGTGVEVVSAISQNSLQFGVTGFPAAQTVEYRIKDLNGTLVQDWTSTGVTEDLEITGKSTYTIKGIMLANGFQGKVSWRIPSTTYYAVELINYYESFISAYAALPTLTEIEASTVLAKEVTVGTRLAAADYTAPDNAGIAANGAALTAMQGDVDFLLAVLRNKRYLEKVGATWYLVIRNDGDTTDILRKALKGTNGTTEITDIQAAALGMEMKSSV